MDSCEIIRRLRARSVSRQWLKGSDLLVRPPQDMSSWPMRRLYLRIEGCGTVVDGKFISDCTYLEGGHLQPLRF